MRPEIKVEAFVLAGGKSSRMGRDKGLVLLKGKPMVSYVLDALVETKIPVNIIANDSTYRSFGFSVFSDVVIEKGPMGGLLTAFANTKAKVVLLVSCDMPLITSKAIQQLLNLADRESIVVATAEGRVNPLFGLYPLILKPEIEDRIASGRLKMTDLILENKHTLVPSISREYPGIFRNVNDEEELKMTEEKMEQFKIKAFGMLAEKLPASEFDFPYFQDTEELLAGLTQEYPQLKSLKFSLAVDKVLVQEKHHLNGNEEIALLPPFSGG